MTSLDDELLPAVLDLILEVGTDIVYEEVTKTPDPTTGTVALGTPVLNTEKSIPPYETEEKYFDGDTVQRGSLMTGVAGSGLTWTPVLGMKATHGSNVYRVTKVTPVYSGDSICLYLIFMEK